MLQLREHMNLCDMSDNVLVFSLLSCLGIKAAGQLLPARGKLTVLSEFQVFFPFKHCRTALFYTLGLGKLDEVEIVIGVGEPDLLNFKSTF